MRKLSRRQSDIPDGSLDDLAQTFTAGNTIPLSWNAYKSPNYIDASKTLLDLWVSAFDYSTNPFSQLLKGKHRLFTYLRVDDANMAEILLENINLTVSGTFTWTIAIPDSCLSISAKYVLRFKVPAATYNPNTADLSSPGFLVLAASTASSTSVSSSSLTTTSGSSTTLASSSSIATSSAATHPSSSALTSTNDEGLATGAKVGVGIGVTVAVIVVLGIFYFFKRKNGKGERQQEHPSRYESETFAVQDPPKYAATVPAAELPTSDVWSQAELSGR